ncbi:uncharacterized protein LOC127284961 isoform X2 [Leptopilina boulardi]|uniref:uncharacterized protein LOC127284961 isoform X2 n=1 Tax=Leptopilina boulardi TaxID=63433 RepID=UPI0021F66D69|nr:uncharacterized protein LOC127284961 isoform X2 [Leptopilina boulardi]
MKILFKVSVFFVLIYNVFNISADSFIKCKENMKFFSEEGREFCDCKDTFLYHVSDNFCYDAYRQGPCSIGHYFILPPGEALATCEKNPCDVDGLVPFNGKCHFLWKSGNPCKDNNTYLGINKEFQIECGSSKYLGSIDRLKSSKSCPENTYMIPVDENNTQYNCECKETFIFSEQNKSCYQAYRQGPCLEGNYFIFSPSGNESKCEENPCHDDGLVPFEGNCHRIYKSGIPCSDEFQVLTVSRNNFQLMCIHFSQLSKQYDRVVSKLPKQNKNIYQLRGGLLSTSQQPGIINPPQKACPPATFPEAC